MPNTFKRVLRAITQHVLLTFILLPAFSQVEAQELVLRGTLTHADHQHYREVPFNVPPGTHRITIAFSYTGREQNAIVDLGLWDSERFRGWSGGNKSTFTISDTDATPSYLPGEIKTGTWILLLGVPNIDEGVSAEFVAKVRFDAPPDFSSAVKREAGWYRGDLHMHDAHSDGSCMSHTGKKIPCPLYKTLETASSRGLDFVAVTDHNTTSHFNDLRELAPYFDDMLLLHGREITTFQGHANVYGTDRFIDFRVGASTVPTMNALLQELQKADAVISINHPSRESGPKCTGCGWTPFQPIDLHLVQSVEVVNSIDANSPISGIPFWEKLLNQGFRLTGIGGSDNHGPDTYPPPGPGSIGYPTTVVYARELSEPAILEGIRKGHVFVDVEGVRGRNLEMNAVAGDAHAIMGDRLNSRAGEMLQVSVRLDNLEGNRLEIVEDGSVRNDLSQPISTAKQEQTFTMQLDGNRHWIRANVRSPQGKLLVVGNPIYLSYPEHTRE